MATSRIWCTSTKILQGIIYISFPSGWTIRAKKINDKFEHIRSKQITRELEQKYGLHPAEKKQAAERPELKKVDYRAGDVKHQLSNTVKALASSYRFQSFTEYKSVAIYI